ncbi:DMT family transporter [Arthrobacter sp. I2-34]|uniref:DMT family transporter n=1 Tax=Arthrobacter hankyongi TaxID=2904801 RepID=A0ABS9L1B6_9MICC|nr:DMT family transporter [Arthrobacter hankyongi]MCG2620432.1 DMT family transporter [Arthrobacter hankyongi]
MPSSAKLPLLLSVPLAVATGLTMPVQGRVNGALGVALGDGLAAALVSFGTGLAVMLVISAVLPAGRAGLRQVLPALRGRSFPRWYLLAGCLGAFMVFCQGLTVPLLGVALFTVATVAGSSVSGLLVDRLGLGPAGRKPVSLMRTLSALLTVTGVIWAVSPKFAGGDGPGWLLPVLLPLLAGFLRSFQQAMNGTQSVHYGNPFTATLINFTVGSAALALLWGIKCAVAGAGNPLPEQWWLYLGGPMGTVFVVLANLLVRSLGVLAAGLSTIAGQLLGSLALDLLVPAAGTQVTAAAVAGTLLTLAAMVLATLPWTPGYRRMPAGTLADAPAERAVPERELRR